jgi:hypothetical protein
MAAVAAAEVGAAEAAVPVELGVAATAEAVVVATAEATAAARAMAVEWAMAAALVWVTPTLATRFQPGVFNRNLPVTKERMGEA